MSFPENLKRFRLERFLTQAELGKKAGLALQTIVRLEAGRTAPYARTVRQLADALGVEPSDLAGPEEVSDGKRRQPG